MRFEKTIKETSSFRLVVNFDGIDDNLIKAENLIFTIFAFDKSTFVEIFSEEISIDEMRILYSQLHSISVIKDVSSIQSQPIIELTNDSLIEFISSTSLLDESIITAVLNKISNADILKSLSILNLSNLSASHKQQIHRSELSKLKIILLLEEKGSLLRMISRISFISEYSAGQPEKVLQNWLENNLWVFGIEYEKMEGFRTISTLSEADLVMKSIDGYLDLIELKKSKYDLLIYDRSHRCYYGSSDLNKVLGQSMHYIKGLQSFAETLQSRHDVKVLRPRVKIVGGRSEKFNNQMFDSMRMINSHLIDINVITYDEILKYGNKIISLYE